MGQIRKKYSVLLPMRNGGSLFRICVNSVLAQTLQDYNLIILDNNSTDGSFEWIKELNDERITIHRSDKDLSIEENWGRIATVEKNEFITLIGHDDILYPNFLERIDALIRQYPSAGLYHTTFNYINADGNIIRKSKPMKEKLSAPEFLKKMLCNEIDIMGTGYVMRKNDYDKIGGIPIRYPSLLFADFELWMNLVKNNFIAVDQDISFAFRLHQSTTGKSKDIELKNSFSVFVNYLVQLGNENAVLNNVIVENAHVFLQFYSQGLTHRLLRTKLKERNGLTVDDYISQTKILAKKLKVEQAFRPEKIKSIRIARIIDRYKILRSGFLIFKKLFPKPIL